MISFITNLTIRETILYGAGLVLSLIVLAGGVVLMVSAFGGSEESSEQEEPAETSSTNRNTQNSQVSDNNGNGSNTIQSQTSTPATLTPSQILPYGVQAFRVVGDTLLYITEDSTLRKISFTSGNNEQLENLDLDNPEYIYIPPQREPKFVIVKNNGSYRTITFGRRGTFQLPETITYLSVEPVSETIYAVMDPQDSMTSITKMSLEGKNTKTILSRAGLEKVQFAGNNLFYVTQDAMYEYNLSKNKERTILNNQSEIPRFTMNRDYFVGVITSEDTSYLYSFSDNPRELKTLDITVPVYQVVWSNQKRAFIHIQDQTMRTFTWQNDQVTRDQVNLDGVDIMYPYASTDMQGQVIFLGKENQGVYRLVTGRI